MSTPIQAIQTSRWRRALTLISDIRNIVWLGVALLIVWRSQGWKIMPNVSANPIAAVSLSGAILIGTFVVMVGAGRLMVWSVPTYKRWRNPHSLVIIPHGGGTAAVELTHNGEPATWECRRRIVKVLYDQSNPDPFARLCYMWKDGESFTSLPLKRGESASIVLATPYQNEWNSRPWMCLRDAETSQGATIWNDGAILELKIKSIPPMQNGTVRKCFQLTRSNVSGDISCVDIQCDK